MTSQFRESDAAQFLTDFNLRESVKGQSHGLERNELEAMAQRVYLRGQNYRASNTREASMEAELREALEKLLTALDRFNDL